MRVSDRGFLLVEAIVATGLVAGALAALAHLIVVCASVNATAHHLTRAAVLAQQTVERLRSEPILSDVSPTSEFLDAHGATLCGGEPSCAGAVYVRGWSVQPSAVVPSAVFVHVTVRHAAGSGRSVHLVSVRPRVL